MDRYWMVRYRTGDVLDEIIGPIKDTSSLEFHKNGFIGYDDNIYIIDLDNDHIKTRCPFVGEEIRRYVLKTKIKDFING